MFKSLQSIHEESKETRKVKSMYISLADGESFTGKFIGVEEKDGNFGPTRYYTFELEDGVQKVFNKKSDKFLDSMFREKVAEGDTIKVTCKGEGFKRVFTVEKIND